MEVVPMRQGGRQDFGRDAAVILPRQLVCLGRYKVHRQCDDNSHMQKRRS